MKAIFTVRGISPIKLGLLAISRTDIISNYYTHQQSSYKPYLHFTFQTTNMPRFVVYLTTVLHRLRFYSVE
jgi:hypothetical protein